jgi:hypothetical protein
MNKSVVNLSRYELTQEEISVLSKGIKFCPTPGPPDPGAQREDMNNLHRTLRWKAFFNDEGEVLPGSSQSSTGPASQDYGSDLRVLDPDGINSCDTFRNQKFKLKAFGAGPQGPQNLEAMILANELEFNKRPVYTPTKYRNLSQGEFQALKTLTHNKYIVVKPVDKGQAICVLDREDYLKEGFKQLSDETKYKKVLVDLTDKHRREVQLLVEEAYQNGEIHESVKKNLTDLTCKTPYLYVLPKIHKGVIPPPGRPVVSGNNGPTEKISKFVDHFLNPTVKDIKSYVKDTTHFLSLVEGLGEIPDSSLLVTLDVAALYPSIPIDLGLEAAKETFEQYRPGRDVKPSNSTLMKFLEAVLRKNNFNFNGKHFLQVSGTAIGTMVAPSFGNRFLNKFEILHVYTYHIQPLVWLRYIDDVFMIWTHTMQDLNDFVEHLNSRLPTIKFTLECSENEIPFLDTKVKKEGTRLITDLYSKPTDSFDYLLYNSSHPQTCKDSIPYSQFLRVRRVCTNMADFEKHVLEMSRHFLRRGYPMELLEEAAILARRQERETLLNKQKEPKGKQDNVFLITTYHPTDNTVRDVVRKNWDLLGKSPTTQFLQNKRLLCGYRRPKNIRDHLVRAAIPYIEGDELNDPGHVEEIAQVEIEAVEPRREGQVQTKIMDFFQIREKQGDTNIQGVPRVPQKELRPSTSSKQEDGTKPVGTSLKERGYSFCNRKGCRYCPKMNKTGKLKCNVTGQEFDCMKNVSCRSSNLIYAITCTRCHKQYVGQTLLRVKDRFVKHFYDVETSDKTKAVGLHFSHKDHNGTRDMEITVLEFIKKPPRSPEAAIIRDRVERRWIHLLRCPAPQGLNIFD